MLQHFVFSPQGSTAPAPSLLHTSSMPRPRVGTDRFHAPGGRATALASGLIHTTLGRATLPLPDSGTKLAPQSQVMMGSASPKGPVLSRVLPCFSEPASKTARHCGTKQGKAALGWACHGTMVKVAVAVLPSCLAHNACQPGATQPGMARGMLEHQPGGGRSSPQAQAPLAPSPGTRCSWGACAHGMSL